MPAKKDISGNKYGWLTVICDSGKRNSNKKVLWHCKCDCGNEIDICKDRMLTDVIPSCGCQSKKKDIIIGCRYGKLTVIKEVGVNKYGKKLWECECDCGNKVIHSSSELNYGRVKSCGCLKHESGEMRKKYNARDRKLYFRWSNIKGRCYNPNDPAYNNYGGRGIKMCPEWEMDFFAFRDWSIENGYNELLSIDRIDNNKGYSPDNCRWTDHKTQSNNRRSNHYITINGVTKTMKQWSEEYGIAYHQVQKRIASGWSEQDAIQKPLRHKKPNGQGRNFRKNHLNEA